MKSSAQTTTNNHRLLIVVSMFYCYALSVAMMVKFVVQ